MSYRTMTVQELIEMLERVPDKSESVFTEGCDCTGSAVGLQVSTDGVLICRDLGICDKDFRMKSE